MEMAGSKRKDKAVAERGERRGHRHKCMMEIDSAWLG